MSPLAPVGLTETDEMGLFALPMLPALHRELMFSYFSFANIGPVSCVTPSERIFMPKRSDAYLAA